MSEEIKDPNESRSRNLEIEEEIRRHMGGLYACRENFPIEFEGPARWKDVPTLESYNQLFRNSELGPELLYLYLREEGSKAARRAEYQRASRLIELAVDVYDALQRGK
jgi:hypothetical protein